MGYHLGSAFVALWEGRLETALEHLERQDKQYAPMPFLPGHAFRSNTESFRVIFNRPSPWCEPVRYAMAAICNMCASERFGEKARLAKQAIQCVRQAIEDDKCMGRGLEP
jgi:hypothetical protein